MFWKSVPGHRYDFSNGAQCFAAGFCGLSLVWPSMITFFRCWAEIDIEAMRSNLQTIRALVAGGVRIIAIVKADAYGHGLPEVARQLDRDVDLFGVASLSEARTIRETGA